MNTEHSNKRYQDKTMQEWKAAFADLYIQMTNEYWLRRCQRGD